MATCSDCRRSFWRSMSRGGARLAWSDRAAGLFARNLFSMVEPPGSAPEAGAFNAPRVRYYRWRMQPGLSRWLRFIRPEFRTARSSLSTNIETATTTVRRYRCNVRVTFLDPPPHSVRTPPFALPRGAWSTTAPSPVPTARLCACAGSVHRRCPCSTPARAATSVPRATTKWAGNPPSQARVCGFRCQIPAESRASARSRDRCVFPFLATSGSGGLQHAGGPHRRSAIVAPPLED